MKSTLKQLIKEINPEYQYFYPDFKDSKEEIEDVDLEFVKLDKWMTNEEIFKLAEEKGLELATFHELANAVKNDPSFFDKLVFTLRDKNEFATFRRGVAERCVYVGRSDFGWNGGWWFAGRRKSSGSGKLGSSAPLDTWPLETLGINGYKYRLVK